LIQREITRLNLRLSGVRNMTRLPDLVFVIDVDREYAAVHEANLLKIPVIALVDTNCDPSFVDYVIPSNDDAIRAIKLMVTKMADAVEEGKAMRKDEELEAEAAMARAGDVEGEAARTTRTTEMEDEIEDEKLLGESTLAKLTPAPKPVETEEENDTEDVEVTEEIEEDDTEDVEEIEEIEEDEE
jgi:small subunit ribosomal protein S2